jgi:hypothetical protein
MGNSRSSLVLALKWDLNPSLKMLAAAPQRCGLGTRNGLGGYFFVCLARRSSHSVVSDTGISRLRPE